MAVAQVELLGIPYTAQTGDPQLQFDCYFQGQAPQFGSDAEYEIPRVEGRKGLLVFVHGGAWRSEDKADHASLARGLCERTGWPVLVPNYRLTRTADPNAMFRHPGHTEDALAFLEFVTSKWTLPIEAGIRNSSDRAQSLLPMVLIGHSCSAHMLASIFLDSSAATPSLTPSPQLQKAVKGIAMSEGIYDLDLLLQTFPKYREWFIEDAFGPRGDGEDYAPYDVTRYELRPATATSSDVSDYPISWLVLHSTGDTLIDTPQSQKMYDHLLKLHNRSSPSVRHQYPASSSIRHENQEDLSSRDDEGESTRSDARGVQGNVGYDFTTLASDHNDILRGNEAYVKLVGDFVALVEPRV